MKKTERIKKELERHDKILEKIDWFYERIEDLDLKVGEPFMMDSTDYVCLDLRYDDLEINYSYPNADGSDIYFEYQCYSM